MCDSDAVTHRPVRNREYTFYCPRWCTTHSCVYTSRDDTAVPIKTEPYAAYVGDHRPDKDAVGL